MSSRLLLEGRRIALKALNGASLLAPSSIEVSPEDRIGISGPSGVGKTLFLRSLCLLEPRATGQVLFNGTEVIDSAVPAFRKRVLYVAQKPAFFPGTVHENIEAVLSFKVHREGGRRLDASVLGRWLEELGKAPDFLSKDAMRLSGGEAQIASLIRALTLGPELLCLDEPTSALDRESVLRVENWLKGSFGGAWLWISHDPEQLTRIAKRVFALKSSFP